MTPDDRAEILALKALGGEETIDLSHLAKESIRKVEQEVRNLEDIAILTSNPAPSPADDPLILDTLRLLAVSERRKKLTAFLTIAAIILLFFIPFWPQRKSPEPTLHLSDLNAGSPALEARLADISRESPLWTILNDDFSSLAQLAPSTAGHPKKGQGGRGEILLSILAPDGVTRHLTPTILWQNQAENLYQVEIKDAQGTVLFEKNKARSPLPFSSLQARSNLATLEPDSIYQLNIRKSEGEGSAITFFATLPDSQVHRLPSENSSAFVVTACLSQLTGGTDPSYSDILTDLSLLPTQDQKEEIVVRLKLYCLFQRSQAEAFQEILFEHAEKD